MNRRDFLRLSALAAVGAPLPPLSQKPPEPQTVETVPECAPVCAQEDARDALGLPCPVCGVLINRWDISAARQAATGRYGVRRYLLWSHQYGMWAHEECMEGA